MKIDICVHPKFAARIQRAHIAQIARKTLRGEKANSALTIYITSDPEIRVLNRKFHKTDAATDVLSFPTYAPDYLGDIVISYDRARVQARQAGWRIVDELDLLAVHGILHLLGYDDLTPRQRAKMWKRQREILGRAIKE